MFKKASWQFLSAYVLSITTLLALVISIPAFYLLSQLDFNNKYSVKKVKTILLNDIELAGFDDLDNDGISEYFRISIEQQTHNAFITVYSNSKVLDQWNFRGKMNTHRKEYIIGDYDHNGLKEMYFFIQTDDSVWLQGIQPMGDRKWIIKDFFLTTINERDDGYDFNAIKGCFFDANKDGNDEMFFAVVAAYSRQPRKVFRFDIENRQLISTPSIGAVIMDIKIADLNHDSKPELLLDVNAHCNTPDSLAPFSDYSCWLMALDTDLNFLFQPIEFPFEFSIFQVYPVEKENGNELILCHFMNGNNTALFLFDSKGKLLKEIRMADDNVTVNASGTFRLKTRGESNFYLISAQNELFSIKENLELEKVGITDICIEPKILDLDGDEEDEILFVREDKKGLVIFRNDFSQPTFIPIDLPANGNFFADVITNSDKTKNLVIQSKHVLSYFDYVQNPFYYLRFIPYSLSFLFIFSLLLLNQWNTRRRLFKKMAAERKITNLQINNILNQVNPHFTFNVLNFIGASIMKDKPKEAYDSLLRFSKVLRISLKEADLIARTIEDELELTKDYLTILQQRFADKFDLEIEVSTNVSMKTLVPKMVVHTYAENAVKHGIIPLERKGKVKIALSQDNEYLKITIEDDGIGRKKAAENPVYSTGKGLNLMKNLYEYLNKINKNKISFTVTDLVDESNNALGTRFEIQIPLEFQYEKI